MEETKTAIQSNFNIELFNFKNEECLKFNFKGKFMEEQAIEGSNEWRNLFDGVGNEKSILIWDCKELTGFENSARVVWQKVMKDLKNKIDCVWLISDSSIIRAGAMVMSTFTGFKIKAVKSEDEINFCRRK